VLLEEMAKELEKQAAELLLAARRLHDEIVSRYGRPDGD
jgi:hypothetical protein